MSLLKNLIRETVSAGAVGAGSIAGVRGSLFGGGTVDAAHEKKRQKEKYKKIEMIRRPIPTVNSSYEFKTLRTMIDLFEQEPGADFDTTGDRVMDLKGPSPSSQQKFDPQDVISKMIAAEKRSKTDDDTVAFGLEDESGQIVKVYVRAEQAEEFESALAQMLSGEDDDDDDENNAKEIAEVLFNLRDKFDIVDVEWPHIEGDVEEEQEVAAEPGAAPAGEAPPEGEIPPEEGGELGGGEGELGGEEGDLGIEGGEEMVAEPEAGEEQVASALTQVIDMMRADAEAKKAEAEARAAEAKAREAEAMAKTAEAKVSQEEQLLDIEAHEEKQKKASDEAKRLAKLAKYRHEVKGAQTRPDFEEEEETDKINVTDFANFLRMHLQGEK